MNDVDMDGCEWVLPTVDCVCWLLDGMTKTEGKPHKRRLASILQLLLLLLSSLNHWGGMRALCDDSLTHIADVTNRNPLFLL